MPKPVDQRPGVLPEITTIGESVVYEFAVAGTHGHEHVIIRCDAFGQIWMTIAPKPDGPSMPDPSEPL